MCKVTDPECTSTRYKLEKFTFPGLEKWCVIFLTGETTLFPWGGEVSHGRTNFFWCGGAKRSLGSHHKCDSYISSSSVKSFTPLSPHRCQSNCRDQYSVWTDFPLSSWERCKTSVEEISPGFDTIKACFRLQADDLVCAIHHPVKDCFYFPVKRHDPGPEPTNHACWLSFISKQKRWPNLHRSWFS